LKHTLLQIDHFAPDAERIRADVIAQGFTTETGPDGMEYIGICKRQVPHWHELIAQAIERPIKARMSFFRLNLAGELPHSWVHSDGLCDRFAAVLYLNPPHQCKGGTAFWRHSALRLDEMPSEQQLGERGLPVDWFNGMMTREWKDLTYWEQNGFIGMQFNRLISYPTSRFHSRYPFEGFGTGPLDGRLVWCCFYDLA
jgi:hypothetical protein